VPAVDSEPARSQPDLRIEISIGAEGTKTTFVDTARRRRFTFQGKLTSDQLSGRHKEVKQGFTRLKNTLWTKDGPAEEKLAKAIGVMYRAGQLLLEDVAGDLVALRQFLSVFRKGLPEDEPPVVYVQQSAQRILPVELWPLWNLEEPVIRLKPLPAFRKDLETAARGFLGFSAIVVHEFVNQALPEGGALWRGGEIPVRKFRYAALRGVAQELEIFRPPVFRSGPEAWPASEADRSSDFFEILWDRERAHRVHHFCCHYECRETRHDSKLRLSCDKTHELPISLEEIQVAFNNFRLKKRGQREGTLPLLFLNACDSANMNPASLGHLPLLMLGSGFGGVVGTYCGVPSLFAQAFARRFYGTFVNGVPLGRALLKTRQDSLFEGFNPLGILYTAYADPYLHIIPEQELKPWQETLGKRKKRRKA